MITGEDLEYRREQVLMDLFVVHSVCVKILCSMSDTYPSESHSSQQVGTIPAV